MTSMNDSGSIPAEQQWRISGSNIPDGADWEIKTYFAKDTISKHRNVLKSIRLIEISLAVRFAGRGSGRRKKPISDAPHGLEEHWLRGVVL
jgi:hypothetical protein